MKMLIRKLFFGIITISICPTAMSHSIYQDLFPSDRIEDMIQERLTAEQEPPTPEKLTNLLRMATNGEHIEDSKIESYLDSVSQRSPNKIMKKLKYEIKKLYVNAYGQDYYRQIMAEKRVQINFFIWKCFVITKWKFQCHDLRYQRSYFIDTFNTREINREMIRHGRHKMLMDVEIEMFENCYAITEDLACIIKQNAIAIAKARCFRRATPEGIWRCKIID